MSKKQEISFLLNKQELDMLNEIMIMDEEVERCIGRAKEEGDKYRLKFSYEVLDELLDWLAASANHEESKRKQDKLDNLYDKLQGFLELSELVKTHGKTKTLNKRNPKTKSKVYIFDIWIDDLERAPHESLRKIGISGTKNLYNLAKIIVQSFGFYFDHPFGFYDSLTNYHNSKIGFELFVDMGEKPLKEGFKGVKKTKIFEVFNSIGDKMLFLFDYGDEWHFVVELKEIRDTLLGEYLPVLLESIGKAPAQYPSNEEG